MKTKLLAISRYGTRLFFILAATGAIGYVVLFTSLGNRILTPVVESVLSSSLETPVSIDTFRLEDNYLELRCHDSKRNHLILQGTFSLLTLNLHAYYEAHLLSLGGMNRFNLPLKTTGILDGGRQHLNIRGNAELFRGSVHYHTQLSRFALHSLRLSLQNIDYQSLMRWLEYPHDSHTALNGEMMIRGFEQRNLSGMVHLSTKTQDFKSMPITDDNASSDFWSLFADENGKIHPFHLDLSLKASIDELGILDQIAGMKLRGKGDLNATLLGDQDRLVLDASTSVASSTTHARLHFKKLRASYLYLNADHADASELFHLFALSAPIDGKVYLNAESNMRETNATLAVRNGSTHPDILKRDYHLTQPATRFDTFISFEARGKQIHYQARFTSDLASLGIDTTTTHDQMLRELLKSIP